MITLSIDDFSCIKVGRFELAPVTTLIGPQGSGKSVTTKLLYFCLDSLQRQYACAEKGLTLDEFKRENSRLFKTWFPPAAWGTRRFNITLAAGAYSVRILRRMSRGSVTDDVAVTYSDFFGDQYRKLVEAYEAYKLRGPEKDEGLLRPNEGIWKIRDAAQERLRKALGPHMVDNQTFVPAGRAFFTSIGRLVAAIEQGSSLDPVTIQFAKLFASLRDMAGRNFYRRGPIENHERREEVMQRLFGGELRFESDSEYVQASDGRKVPFSALSSGQQELLPMWLMIDFYASRSILSEQFSDIFYIEEPEAHLFPQAQSLLMDFLIGQMLGKNDRRSLILTTHSPYILSKLNTFIKAGQLGRQRRTAGAVAEVIPRECWLSPDHVRAYAIENGKLIDLRDSEGLIDASYIDGVSADVSRTYEALLDIEYPETVR